MSLVLYLEVVPDSVLARNRRDTQNHLTEVIFMKELLTEEWLEWQDPTRDRKYPQGRKVEAVTKDKGRKSTYLNSVSAGALREVIPTEAMAPTTSYHIHRETAVERRDIYSACLSCCPLISNSAYHRTRSQRAKKPAWYSPWRSLSHGRACRQWG